MNLTLLLPANLVSCLTPAVTSAPAQLVSREGVAPVVAMVTEPAIVLDSEEGVAPPQHETIDAHAILSSSM